MTVLFAKMFILHIYMHFLNLEISFPFCSLKFTYLKYTVRGDQ